MMIECMTAILTPILNRRPIHPVRCIGERLLFLLVGSELEVQALVNKPGGEPLQIIVLGGASSLDEVPKVLRLEPSTQSERDAEDGKTASNDLGERDLDRHGRVLSKRVDSSHYSLRKTCVKAYNPC